MPAIAYIERRFSASSLAIIEHANEIIEEYSAEGYSLTLRQLYYQFVSRDLIANKVTEYKRLGGIVNDARLAGLIDWKAIEDRTRNLESLSHWDDPADAIESIAEQFRIDKWENQPYHVEVWIEKEALAGVFQRICEELDIAFFACRGYTSQSEMWVAAMRLMRAIRRGKIPTILHFGDHDPSGIDMTRDIIDRLNLFMGGGVVMHVERKALNMDQIQEYSPPPNPAKETDSRFAGYLKAYGDESWELDALEPSALAGLVRAGVYEVRDADLWEAAEDRENTERSLLDAAARDWNKIAKRLRT